MKAGVLGSGPVGRTFAAGLHKHGHDVALGCRDLQGKEEGDWLAQNPGAKLATFAQAARHGELLVLAVPGRAVESAVQLAGAETLAGKTLLDLTNPLADAPPVQGVLQYTTGPNQSLGEQVQRLAPKARVVKSFNSVGAALMVNPRYAQGPPTMFLCGDDAAAKAQVSELIRQFGWEPLDCGGIIAARALEPLCMLWCLPGFLRGQWTHAFKVLTQ